MAIRTYKTYRFINKDPVIDELRTMVRDKKASYKQIHEDSDVATSTLHGWFKGKTRRPTHATVRAVMRSLGYDYKLVKFNKK